MEPTNKRRMVLRRPPLRKTMPPLPGRREGACSITDLAIGECFCITPDKYLDRIQFVKISSHTAELYTWDDDCAFQQHFPDEYPIYRC